MSDSALLCPWNFPGKNTGAGRHFLLQGILQTQGSNSSFLSFLHWQADSLPIAPPWEAQYKHHDIFFSCSFLTLDINWIILGSYAKHKTQDSRRNSLTPKFHGSHNFFFMWCYHQLLQSDSYFVSVPSFHPIWPQVDAFLISVPPTLQISFFLSPAKCCYLNSCHWYPAHLPLWENKFKAYSPF